MVLETLELDILSRRPAMILLPIATMSRFPNLILWQTHMLQLILLLFQHWHHTPQIRRAFLIAPLNFLYWVLSCGQAHFWLIPCARNHWLCSAQIFRWSVFRHRFLLLLPLHPLKTPIVPRSLQARMHQSHHLFRDLRRHLFQYQPQIRLESPPSNLLHQRHHQGYQRSLRRLGRRRNVLPQQHHRGYPRRLRLPGPPRNSQCYKLYLHSFPRRRDVLMFLVPCGVWHFWAWHALTKYFTLYNNELVRNQHHLNHVTYTPHEHDPPSHVNSVVTFSRSIHGRSWTASLKRKHKLSCIPSIVIMYH